MASLPECLAAVESLAARLDGLAPELRRRHVVDRTLSCRLPDLHAVLFGTLDQDGLSGLRCEPGQDTAGAQVRLSTSSDDLLALVAGELSAPAAWATGRLKVEAGVLDLLKLRSLL